MKILAFESSAKTASCAVCEEDKVLCESDVSTGLTHSQTLMPMVQDMLKNAQLELCEIDQIAVSSGPGSFTGLRIGVAAAKGLAQPLSLDCKAVSTLEALAFNLAGFDCIAVCVMDARRNQVYNAIFDVSRGNPKRLCDDRAISISDLLDELKQENYKKQIILVGDGANLCYNSFKDEIDISISSPQNRLQKASSVAFCAFAQKNKMSAKEVRVNYLRPSQAERELKDKQKGDEK